MTKEGKRNFKEEIARCSKLRDQGSLKKSLSCLNDVLDSIPKDDPELIPALILRGVILRDIGKPKEAIEVFVNALETSSINSLDSYTADILRLLSYSYISLGILQEAQSLALASLRGSRLNKFKRQEVDAAACVGHIFEMGRDFQKALAWYFEALEICEETEYWERKSTLLGDIGKVYGIIGQLPESIAYLKKALALATKIEYVKAIISSLYRLGDSYRSIDDFKKARDYYVMALNRAEETDFRREQGDCLYRLGVLEIADAEPDEALNVLDKAVGIFEEIDYFEQKIHALLAIGHAWEKKRDNSEALKTYFTAFDMIRESVDEHTDAFVQVVENIITQWHRLQYTQEANRLTRLTGQLREYAKMSGVFEDFGKKDRVKQTVSQMVLIIERTSKMHGNIFVYDALSIDFNVNRAFKDDNEVKLTSGQWKLLHCLWSKRGGPCTEAELLNATGVAPGVETRSIDVQISKIRGIIGKECIPKVPKIGYRLLVKE